MKISRNNKKNQIRISRKRMSKTNLVILSGGVSYSGTRQGIHKPIPTIERFARYWDVNMHRNVWYSSGQTGYYFSNLTHYYMSTTHTHIYRIDNVDENQDGRKRVYYSTKINNVQQERNVTVELDYKEIAGWLTRKNVQIGADRAIHPMKP